VLITVLGLLSLVLIILTIAAIAWIPSRAYLSLDFRRAALETLVARIEDLLADNLENSHLCLEQIFGKEA
jgi:hypothetical protein